MTPIFSFFAGVLLSISAFLGGSPQLGASVFQVVQGGTGNSTFTSSRLLYGNGTAALSAVATSSLAVTSPITFSGTIGAQVGGAAGSFGCASCALFGYDFTPATNYGVNTNSTTTPIWLKGALGGVYSFMASNTAAFDQVLIGSSTTGTQATSTVFGNLSVRGNASTTNTFSSLIASSTSLVVSSIRSAILLTGADGAVTSYAGFSCSGNNAVTQISSTGGITCGVTAFGFPFTPTTNYGTTTSATSTAIWARLGFMASSTSYLDQLQVGSSTITTLATSTFFGNLEVNRVASTTWLTAVNASTSVLTIGATPNCSGSNALTTTATGLVACGAITSSSGAFPFTPLTTYAVNTSATTTALWSQNYLFASSTAYMASAFHASSTAPQLYLSDTLGNAMFAFRAISGNLFLATTSFTGAPFATSTFPILTITSNGYLGLGTTSPWSSLTLDRVGFASSSITITEFRISTTTNKTIDARDGNAQLFQIGSSATTITLTGFLSGTQMKLTVCNPNAAAGVITWATAPANLLLWEGGTTTQTTLANKCDVFSFIGTQSTSSVPGALNKIFGVVTPGF